VLARLVDRRVGGLMGETGRVASTAHAFLVFSFLLAVGYTVFFAVYGAAELGPMVMVNLGCALGFAAGIVVVRMGRQFLGSIIALIVATTQVLLVTRFIGWESGLHLYLMTGGQVVFMIFTQRQRALRWLFAAVAVIVFLYCQLAVPETGFGYALPSSTLSVTFTINATLTLMFMYALAAVSHYRGIAARQEADENAARAEYLANTDPLTGLANRRPVIERLDRLSASTRYSVAIADLDHFKGLNDTYGHACGDKVLSALGERFRTHLRASDAVGRWGGEEFIFVMSDLSIDDAAAMMERMRAAIADHPVPCTGHSHDVTLSVGVAEGADDHMSYRVIKRADDALYVAKQSGRNRVSASPAIPPPAGDPATGEAPLERLGYT
jgi:diguanylate cyclase (GGDEF)-like protein